MKSFANLGLFLLIITAGQLSTGTEVDSIERITISEIYFPGCVSSTSRSVVIDASRGVLKMVDSRRNGEVIERVENRIFDEAEMAAIEGKIVEFLVRAVAEQSVPEQLAMWKGNREKIRNIRAENRMPIGGYARYWIQVSVESFPGESIHVVDEFAKFETFSEFRGWCEGLFKSFKE